MTVTNSHHFAPPSHRRNLPLATIPDGRADGTDSDLPGPINQRRSLPLATIPNDLRSSPESDARQADTPHRPIPTPDESRRSGRNRPWRRYGTDALLALLLLAVCLLALGLYFGKRYQVMSGSMEPTLQVGETVWAVRIMEPPARGDIVSFPNPANDGEILLKRVIALPGEQVAAVDGVIEVNHGRLDESVWVYDPISTADFGPVVLGDDEYFVMGDNRAHSIDSRIFGPVPLEAIGYKVRVEG